MLKVVWKLLSVFSDFHKKANLGVLGRIIFQRQKATFPVVLEQRASITSATPHIYTEEHAIHVKMRSTWVQFRYILSYNRIKILLLRWSYILSHKLFLFHRSSFLGICCRHWKAKRQNLDGFTLLLCRKSTRKAIGFDANSWYFKKLSGWGLLVST